MSRWYFIRHAQSKANVSGVYNPENDELTQAGITGCTEATHFFKTLSFDAVFSSPLQRAVQTAEHLGFTPVIVTDLADRDFGEFAHKPFGSIATYCQQHGLDKETFVPKDGESRASVRKRAMHFFDTIPEGDFLFVTHADIIADVVGHVTGNGFVQPHNLALWVFENKKLTQQNWQPWKET